MNHIQIRVLAYHDGDHWVAQGLEYDVFARANRLDALPKAFSRALMSNVCVNEELGRSGLEGIKPAPSSFWDQYEKATLGVSPTDAGTSKARSEAIAMRVAA